MIDTFSSTYICKKGYYQKQVSAEPTDHLGLLK